MINSFGTEADGEGDGSGGKRKRTGEAAAAVRAVRLFGCSGCSAVRLFGLFGCSGCSAVRAAAALLPRMASGEQSEAPTCRELLISLFVFVLCAIYY